MRPSTFIAKVATRAVWPLTRQDRGSKPLVPPVLCYHRVLPRPAKSRRRPSYSVTPGQFIEQMSVLAGEGFTSLTLQEFQEAALGLRAFPARSALITFDDGYNDNHSLAWPIAREFGVKLNLFICTGLVEGNSIQVFERASTAERLSRADSPELWQALSWQQIREMNEAGVDVGFHSHSHRNLGTSVKEEIASDTATGIELFRKHLGYRPRFFAFPFGHFGSYSSTATAVLEQCGFEMFFTTELGRTIPATSQKTFSRIVIHPEDDVDSFRRKLYGGYDWIGGLRKLNYSVRGRLRWSEACW